MILTIDVGGTKVLIAAFSDDGQILNSKKFKTPIMYPDFVAQVKQTIATIIGDEQPIACAIALPASLDRENGVALFFGNLPWENVRIRDDLSDTIHCPIYLENDAKMAGLAEADAIKDHYSRVLYVTISTGIGIGMTIDGKIDQGVQDAGGKALLVEHNGNLMAWEEYASGKAIVKHTGKMASQITDESDWYVVARNIALGLIQLIVLLSPEVIIIGGGVGAHLPKFQEKLYNELEIYHNKMIKMPQIRQSQHPEQAVIYGGYLLAKQQLNPHHNDHTS